MGHSFILAAMICLCLSIKVQGFDGDEAAFLQQMVAANIDANGKYPEMNEFLLHLDSGAKKQLWWELTKELDKSNGFRPAKAFETSVRRSIDLWDQQVASSLVAKQLANQHCAETGDGHFLRMHFHAICGTSLIVDKYNARADVKLDLDLPPTQAPEAIKASHSTIDVLISHQVFEHLKRPSVGIANLNALLRVGGQVVFSTPFVVQDHAAPKDFFRYTVASVHALLTCAGFRVHELRGLGNRLEDLAYLGQVSSDMMDVHDLTKGCDGLTTDDCTSKYYSGVAAVGIKTENKTLEQIHDCFG